MEHFIKGQLIGLKVNLNIDGQLFSKEFGTEEEADALFNAIIAAKENPTDDAVEMLKAHLSKKLLRARRNGLEYDPNTGEVFLPGSSTPVPELIVETVEKYHEKGYPLTPIINFWKLLLINPDERVRTSLFDFISKHDFAITDNGYMVVYKAVEYFDIESSDLDQYVVDMVEFVKDKWGCGAGKYAVYMKNEGATYHITKQVTIDKWDEKEKDITKLGNLKVLNEEIQEKKANAIPTFLPIHVNRSKERFDLKKEMVTLGVPQTMTRSECDSDPRKDCSYGLHVGATPYIKKFKSWNNVSAPVLTCLVNPAHVIAVPDYDHSKMRVCEYFPYALSELDSEDQLIPINQPYVENDYIEYEMEEVERQIKAINAEEERVGVDATEAEDDRSVEEVLKALKDRKIVLNTVEIS